MLSSVMGPYKNHLQDALCSGFEDVGLDHSWQNLTWELDFQNSL